MNVLYDKNHYKLALGQLNTAKHLISSVGKDYCRLLKFGDSLYRCKQLKRAALGRMATIMRRQKDPLAYLEEVRQHMSRLPTIDPTTRTLLVCGYPNVGKSSFVNKVTRADVDVQPYAFTTKSLFVGHMDYKYLRWQVIDTPGVLDHPLDEMNTIEMQSITALAHLRACVLYFMDLSEQCGYTLEAQCKLFHSIRPLFADKPTFVVLNKADVVRRTELSPENEAMLEALTAPREDGTPSNVHIVEASCVSEENVMGVRNSACDALLAARVAGKERARARVDAVANRVRVAMPRTGTSATTERPPFIPDQVLARKKYDKLDPERRMLERDLEEQNGGAGVYSMDTRKNWLLQDDSWKYDVMPEVINGKNVSDFIDPDILKRLEELEAEEERLESAGFYDDSDEERRVRREAKRSGEAMDDDAEVDDEEEDEEAIRTTAEAIRDRKTLLRMKANRKRELAQNNAPIPRSRQAQNTLSTLAKQMRDAGLAEGADSVLARGQALSSKAKAGSKRRAEEMEVDDDEDWSDDADGDASMEVDEEGNSSRKRVKGAKGTAVASKGAGVRGARQDRHMVGLGTDKNAKKARQLKDLATRGPNYHAKAGESDRHIMTRMPQHLFKGKRKNGTASHR